MQETSATWDSIYENPNHLTEFKIRVNNIEYGHDVIVSLNSSADIFNNSAPIVGQCISSTLKASLYLPNNSIPRRSECKVLVRLTDGSSFSEWLPKGTFYINKRSNAKNGVLTIEAYDAMMKTDKVMYTQSGQQDTWPKTDIEVLTIIAEDYLGVEIDSATESAISKEYEIQYPGYGDGGYTVRQVLGYIGAMYGGNWIIDDYNHLKLLQLKNLPHTIGQTDHFLGEDLSSEFSQLIQFQTISRVTVNVGTDESTGDPIYYTAGSDGFEFIIECPWGTQNMADQLLSDLSTVVYYPYIIDEALINPAFELWDGIGCDGVYSSITAYTRYFDPLFTAAVSATGESELEDEYPYVSQDELKQKQTNADTVAKLIVTNNNITSEVQRATDSETTISTRVTQSEYDIVQLFNTDSTYNDRIEALRDEITEHEQEQVEYIRYSSSGIELGSSNARFKAKLSSTELSFEESGTKVAYISNKRLHITEAEIENNLFIGKWAFIKKNDGSLALKYMSTGE